MSSSIQLPLISIAHYSKFFQFHRDESQKIIFSRFFFLFTQTSIGRYTELQYSLTVPRRLLLRRLGPSLAPCWIR